MGEQSISPTQNGMSENEDHDHDSDVEMSESDEEGSPEEFNVINGQLDALNSALDDIEQKNDNIHAQLLSLLQSNRDIRTQMQQMVEQKGSASENGAS